MFQKSDGSRYFGGCSFDMSFPTLTTVNVNTKVFGLIDNFQFTRTSLRWNFSAALLSVGCFGLVAINIDSVLATF